MLSRRGSSSARARRLTSSIAVASVCVASCDGLAPAPRAQVTVVVDTDLPVPKLAGTLRIDVFRLSDARGAWGGLEWIDENEFVLEDRRSWPSSFAVTLGEPAVSTRYLLRLRLYRSGKVRTYHGERLLAAVSADGDPSDLFLPPKAPEGEQPRLVRDGADKTPDVEPMPSLTVDRLVTFNLVQADRWQTSVRLNGDCAGIQADLGNRRTCIDGALRAPLADAVRDQAPKPFKQGIDTWEGRWPITTGPKIATACDDPTVEAMRHRESSPGEPLFDEEVCVPGGAFLFGESRWAAGRPADDHYTVAGMEEERIAVVPRLFIDKYEYSVRRARRSPLATELLHHDALADYSDVLGNQVATCTFGRDRLERDALPLNCVTDEQAEALCESEGRELTRAVVFQYALRNGNAAASTEWPWGDALPERPCESVITDRDPQSGVCRSMTPVPALDDPNERRGSMADASQSGVHDLVGSLAEVQRDSALPWAARCWRAAGSVLPTCLEGGSRMVLGSAWVMPLSGFHDNPIPGSTRRGGVHTRFGLRCMRRIEVP